MKEANLWRAAREGPEPKELTEKVFTPKCKIPVLDKYEAEVYPEEYWDCWPVKKLEDSKVETWVKPEELQALCWEVGIRTDFGQAKVVLSDLKFGCDLGATGRSRLASSGPNGRLALLHGEKVQDTIGAFVKKGIYVGPMKLEEAKALGPLKVHPITAREKADGSVRVITDASYPYDAPAGEDSEEPASLNENINKKDFPVKMDGMDVFLEQLEDEGRGAMLAKEDLTDAYKHIPVRWEDWRLQAMAWGDRLFVDTRLMFGTSSSAGIFDRFDALLLQIAVMLSKISKRKAMRFLDDVYGVESRHGKRLEGFLHSYRVVCDRVGAKLDPRKRVPPATSTTILGIEFDTVEWSWKISEEKARKIFDKILAADTTQGTLKERQSLVGSIMTLIPMMPDARVRFAELVNYMGNGRTWNLQMSNFWKMVVKRAATGGDIQVPRQWLPGDCLEVHPDAAGPQESFLGRGIGLMISDGRWGFLPYPWWMGQEPKFYSPVMLNGTWVDFRHKMSFLEAIGPLWALVELGNQATGRTVLAHVDNIGVHYAHVRGYSLNCPFLNAVMQATTVVARGLGARLKIRHINRWK